MDEKDFLQKLHAWNTEVILCCGNLILKLALLSISHGGHKSSYSQAREKRQQGSLERFEGDILVGRSDISNPSTMSAHLANRDKLWPSGLVEYQFYKSFPKYVTIITCILIEPQNSFAGIRVS